MNNLFNGTLRLTNDEAFLTFKYAFYWGKLGYGGRVKQFPGFIGDTEYFENHKSHMLSVGFRCNVNTIGPWRRRNCVGVGLMFLQDERKFLLTPVVMATGLNCILNRQKLHFSFTCCESTSRRVSIGNSYAINRFLLAHTGTC